MKTKLLTKELEEKLPSLYSTESIPLEEKTVVVKYFSPYNGWTWYATEYDPKEKLFFGLVQGFETEWGLFSLEEFEEINKSKPVPMIERDKFFQPKKVKDLGLVH